MLLALCACTPARPPDDRSGPAPPLEPAPVEPAPVEPAPVEPAPAAPAPAEPTPADPAPAKPAPKPAEPRIELTPAEQATDDVSGFMGAYISAIHRARARAKELNEPVRIRIDREAHRVTLTWREADDEGREPVVHDAFAYAASVQILKEPESVVVQPDEVISFIGRDFKHPLPQKDTAHVLACVPKFPPHAFFRFARGKREFLAQQTSYIDETSD